MSGVLIRAAREEDAASACEVLRRSIVELCGADHGGDPDRLARWLANKTPEHVAAWIRGSEARVLVAVRADRIVAVGSVAASGRIGLNYVAPEARFQGVSKRMLRALEALATDLGAERCTLESTETAVRFYRAAGYSPAGAPVRHFGLVAHPMSRRLRPAQ